MSSKTISVIALASGGMPILAFCWAGRVDAKQADPVNRLPAESFSAQQLKQAFEAQSLSVQEFVALAGAHTVSCICLHSLNLSSLKCSKPGLECFQFTIATACSSVAAHNVLSLS